MFLNIAYSMHTLLFQHFGHMGPFGPFGHMGYFGPFAGRISPLLLFFGILFLFAMLRRGHGGNRYHGGYYGPQYRQGPPTQGPAGDVGRNPSNPNPQDPGSYKAYGSYNPYAGQASSQYNPYGNYGDPGNAGEQGAQTIRVDQMGNNAGQGAGTNTIRMDSIQGSTATGAGSGQPTTPLRGQPVIPANEYDPNRARVEQQGDATNGNTGQ